MEDKILGVVAGGRPFNKTLGNWSVTLGSGAHENNAERGIYSFHAIDINLEGGDREKEVLSIAYGHVSKVDLSYGTVEIDHPAKGDVPAWQSVYLHMPIYPLGTTAENGSPKYGMKTINGAWLEGFEIWNGKEMQAGDQVGIIRGRGVMTDGNGNSIKGVGPAGSDENGYAISDSQFGDHIHFEVHKGGKSINLGRMVTQAWKIPIYGLEQGQAEIKWSTDVDIGGQGGAYVNDVEKLIFFRDPAITVNSQTDYWLAWEDHNNVSAMQRLAWESYEYRDATGTLIRDQGWVSQFAVSDRRKIWHRGTWQEQLIVTRIYDPHLKQYVAI